MIGWRSRSTRGLSHTGTGVRAHPFPCDTACTLCIRPGAATLARVCSNAGAGVHALLPSRLACSLNFCALALASSYHAWLVPAPVSLFHLLALCSALCSRLLALSWRLEALFYSALIFSHLFALAPPLAVYSPLSSIALAPARSLVTILPGRTYRLGFRSHKALFCYTVKSMQNNKPWYCRRLMIIVFTMIYGVVL